MPIANGDHTNFDSLIEKLNNGDPGAFEEIYKRCCSSIAFLCQKFCDTKEDAEEVVQDTFLIAYKKAAELRGDTLLAYLRKIAIHECFRKRDKNSHRYEYIVRSDTPVEDQQELDESILPEEALQNKERQAELLRIIEQLPKNRREMVYLYYYADISIEEVARLYDCTANNVYQTLFAARSTIKSKLEGEDKKTTKVTAFVPIGALFLVEEQVFAASYVSAAAPSVVGTGITGTSMTTVAKSIKGYVITACAAAVCVVSVATLVALQPATENDVYETIYEAYIPTAEEPAADYMENIAEEAQSSEPAEERLAQAEDPGERVEPADEPEQAEDPEPSIEGEPDEPEPIPEPIDKTPEILAALAAATSRAETYNLINYYGFVFADQARRHSTSEQFRFYVLDAGSGDILIGMVTHEDGTGWNMKFQHFAGGKMPTDIIDLLRFMG